MSISLEEAIKRISQHVEPLRPEKLPLDAALGCMLAEDVIAQVNQPPFPRSPYDGYALISADSVSASQSSPVTLKVVDESFAGKPAKVGIKRGEAVRITTGGVIPEGADCVIMQEHTDEGARNVKIYECLERFENYCHQGEDFKRGETLAKAGQSVTAALVAVAASAGYTQLCVYPLPRVAVLASGDELQKTGEPLLPGHIYNSNSFFISGRLTELGVPNLRLGEVDDDLEKLKAAVTDAAKAFDVVICSGGVSVGPRDLLPLTLEELGAKIVFHGVAIKPGMPAALAILGKTPVLALSGNPFAAAASFELLARPLIAARASAPRFCAPISAARLKEPIKKKRPVRRFQRGVTEKSFVSIPGEQGNGQLRTMIGCDCLAELPAGEEELPIGTEVKIHHLGENVYGFPQYCESTPTVLAISGVKKSGKTLLIERLLPMLCERGIKTAVIKHDAHSFTPDTPGTDTFRFFQAGACGTVIFDSEKLSLTRQAAASREELIAMFPEADLILLEGMSRSPYPKIELIPENPKEGAICDPKTCIAYVSADNFKTDKPVFSPDDVQAILDFIADFAKKQRRV